jgi:hypothetical protein
VISGLCCCFGVLYVAKSPARVALYYYYSNVRNLVLMSPKKIPRLTLAGSARLASGVGRKTKE